MCLHSDNTHFYLRAEKRGFSGGNVADDWLKAEAEIDHILRPSSKAGDEEMTTKQDFQQKLEMQLKEWEPDLKT
jgi:hypothetical protein